VRLPLLLTFVQTKDLRAVGFPECDALWSLTVAEGPNQRHRRPEKGRKKALTLNKQLGYCATRFLDLKAEFSRACKSLALSKDPALNCTAH
jgi:hypothetical protein